jgi:cytochrome c556
LKHAVTIAAGIVVAGATLVFAQEAGNPPSVNARQSHMQLNAFDLGQLGGMAKGEIPYDADLAKGAAANLVARAGMDQRAYWPAGTSHDEVPDSAAKPELFANYDAYMKLTDDLRQAAMQMESVAGNGVETIGGQMQALGAACGACHKEYRLKLE